MLLAALAAVLLGLAVGLLSGLAGIGGGVLIVPFLYVAYAQLGVAADVATPLAHATSLAAIVPPALLGLWRYQRHGVVVWRAALPVAVVAALAAATMAPFAARLPGSLLRAGFGVLLLGMATDLALRGRPRRSAPGARALAPPLALAVLIGIPVGVLSAALGVGGGLPATVGLYYLLSVPLDALAATSLVVVALTATAGALSYILTPAGELPVALPWVVGHVDLGAAVPVALGALLTVPGGVALNRRLPGRTLRLAFAVLLAAIGLSVLARTL